MPPRSLLKTWAPRGCDLQAQSDVAVVIPTTLRPTLARALRSVFAQDFAGRVQILVGIDKPVGSFDMLEAVCRTAPSHCIAQVFYPGYSTSVRHGGLTGATDGGALRTVLSYLANAPLLAYLDDDNWWAPEHLGSLAGAIARADWAFALRWFVHPDSARPICVDRWESIGPGAGIFRERFGGFVDPNCLMMKRVECAAAIPLWTVPLGGIAAGMAADRNVFSFLLRHGQGAATGRPSVYYVVRPTDPMHQYRLRFMGEAYARRGAVSGARNRSD